MEERDKKLLVGAIDVIVAIFIVIIGILGIIFGIFWDAWVNQIISSSIYWLHITAWIFIITGITTIIYGIKRIINNVII